jgi:hypothetical protein
MMAEARPMTTALLVSSDESAHLEPVGHHGTILTH